MLYQVPSGSKSSGSGLATGLLFWKALRLAMVVVEPSALTRKMVLSVSASPCEQPAPASNPYSVSPTNFTSETPLTRLPSNGLVWLDGRPSATVVTWWTVIGSVTPG